MIAQTLPTVRIIPIRKYFLPSSHHFLYPWRRSGQELKLWWEIFSFLSSMCKQVESTYIFWVKRQSQDEMFNRYCIQYVSPNIYCRLIHKKHNHMVHIELLTSRSNSTIWFAIWNLWKFCVINKTYFIPSALGQQLSRDSQVCRAQGRPAVLNNSSRWNNFVT